MSLINQNIKLYKSLFRGRYELYGVRWERDGKSGNMPAYDADWSNYEKHELQGGTFSSIRIRNFNHMMTRPQIILQFTVNH